MLRTLVALLTVLLLVAPSLGQDVIVAKKKAGGGGSCSVDSNELGTRGSSTAEALAIPGDSVRCNLWAPDCSGKLYTAYLHHRTTGADNAKICVYADDGDSNPDAGDGLLACSGAISGDANATYYNAAMASNPSVSTGTNYWLCIIGDAATGWDTYDPGGGLAQKYQAIAGAYDSPPATLTGSWGNNSDTTQATYVTVGD